MKRTAVAIDPMSANATAVDMAARAGAASPQARRQQRLWIWLTLPPLAAVLGGIATLYLALKYPDPVIKAPVERLGKAPVVDNRAAQLAATLGLQAHLERSPEGQLRLHLSGAAHPAALELLWIHPTRSELDRGAILTLTSPADAEGAWYQGVLPEPAAARGQWLLRDMQQSWRLEVSTERTTGEFELRPVLR